MVNISKTFVFAMVNWLCSLCCIRYGNLVVFVMDGVQKVEILKTLKNTNGTSRLKRDPEGALEFRYY